MLLWLYTGTRSLYVIKCRMLEAIYIVLHRITNRIEIRYI